MKYLDCMVTVRGNLATLRDIAALALAGLSLAAGSSALAAPVTVEGLSLQAEDAVAVLRLELNGKPKARVFTLSGPPRAVIDLSEAALVAGTVLPAPTGPIRGVRKGPLPAGGLRLVLDLERELRVTQRNLGPSDRGRYELLIELSDPQPIGASPTEPLGRAAPEVSNPPIRAAHAPADSGRDVVVAIDPGHGGV
ncbi:MAG: AMIN domain-containing protein, partial [Steroidobacteraceae bacterium]|nr:AMIN domain-containing protein [Steroidobacteraceae bacterium]